MHVINTPCGRKNVLLHIVITIILVIYTISIILFFDRTVNYHLQRIPLTCWSIYIIYNSVVTMRHNSIISSASVPLNAKKVAVKKDIEVDLSMFGPEL